MNLSELVQHYIDDIRPYKDGDLEWLRARESLAEVIEVAAMARTRWGKRHPHQWRLTESAMGQGRDLLLACQDAIRKCPTFDDLLDLVETLVLPIPGLGEIYAYDTAFRIGVYLNIMPERVYLHRGVRDGAKALGLDPNRRAIEMSELPEEIRCRAAQGTPLQPHEVEDFLCI